MCAVWFALFIFGVATISKYDQPLDSATLKADSSLELVAEREAPLLRILLTKKFICLYIIAFTHKMQGYWVGNSFKQIGFLGGLPDSTLTVIGSFGAFFNGVVKIVLASSLDYYPFKPLFAVVLAFTALTLILIPLTVQQPYLFAVLIWLNFFGDGSITSSLPVVTLNVFGIKRGPQVYGYMFSIFGLSSVIGLLMVQTVQTSIGYQGMLFVCLGFTMVASGFFWFYRFDEPFQYSSISKLNRTKTH